MGNEQQFVPDLTLKAYTNLAAYQFRCAKMTSGRTATFSNAATDKTIGVLIGKDAIVAGQGVQVRVFGIAKLKAGSGGWSAGQYIVSGTGGVGVAITPAATTPNYVVGWALEDAAENDIASVFVCPQVINV